MGIFLEPHIDMRNTLWAYQSCDTFNSLIELEFKLLGFVEGGKLEKNPQIKGETNSALGREI